MLCSFLNFLKRSNAYKFFVFLFFSTIFNYFHFSKKKRTLEAITTTNNNFRFLKTSKEFKTIYNEKKKYGDCLELVFADVVINNFLILSLMMTNCIKFLNKYGYMKHSLM